MRYTSLVMFRKEDIDISNNLLYEIDDNVNYTQHINIFADFYCRELSVCACWIGKLIFINFKLSYFDVYF